MNDFLSINDALMAIAQAVAGFPKGRIWDRAIGIYEVLGRSVSVRYRLESGGTVDKKGSGATVTVKKASEVRWWRIPGLVALTAAVAYGCQLVLERMSVLFPHHVPLVNAFVTVLFSVLLAYLVMRPMAREFGYRVLPDRRNQEEPSRNADDDHP